MYLYLSSTQSTQFFVNNSPAAFRVKLPKRLKLCSSQRWSIALLDICLPKLKSGYKPLYLTVNSSVVESSVVSMDLMPTLNRIYFQQLKKYRPLLIFEHPRYIPVTTDTMETLDIYLTDSEGNKPSFDEGELLCTLHLTEE